MYPSSSYTNVKQSFNHIDEKLKSFNRMIILIIIYNYSFIYLEKINSRKKFLIKSIEWTKSLYK